MKTKEEVLKHYVAEYWQQQIDEKHPLMTQVLMAMDEYAQQQVKNLNIPAVMGELTCDNCGCHPNVIYTTSKGRFCERCKPAS